MDFNEMLEQLIKLHKDFLKTLEEMEDSYESEEDDEEEDHSMGMDMGIPELVDLKSPKNAGKMIPQIQDEKYGSLGNMTLNICLKMGDK